MKKKFAFTALVIMSCLFIGGLIMLLSSAAVGQSSGSNAIQANGGSMDTQRYYFIIEATTENFRTAGMVVSLVGGLGLLISGYEIYKEI